jgi:hypothetical protein
MEVTQTVCFAPVVVIAARASGTKKQPAVQPCSLNEIPASCRRPAQGSIAWLERHVAMGPAELALQKHGGGEVQPVSQHPPRQLGLSARCVVAIARFRVGAFSAGVGVGVAQRDPRLAGPAVVVVIAGDQDGVLRLGGVVRLSVGRYSAITG